MELFAKLFDSLLVLVYQCFDRIVIHGYLSGLSRPEQVVYFFSHVLGIPVVDQDVLSRRAHDYPGWVEAFAGRPDSRSPTRPHSARWTLLYRESAKSGRHCGCRLPHHKPWLFSRT